MTTKTDGAPAPQDELDIDDVEHVDFNSVELVMSEPGTRFWTMKAWANKLARFGTLTAAQMIQFLENNDKAELKRKNTAVLIALSLVDKEGKRLINTEDPKLVEKFVAEILTRDAQVNATLADKILEKNGLNKKDAKAIAKNALGEAEPGASPTALPSSSEK